MSITYKSQDDRITLEMTRDDFDRLTLIVGFAIGAALGTGDKELAYRWLGFANDLNATNPNFTPFELPEEWRKKQ